MKTTFIKSVEMLQTGVYIMNEVITLEDDTVLVISEDGIYFYKSLEDYYTCAEETIYIER